MAVAVVLSLVVLGIANIVTHARPHDVEDGVLWGAGTDGITAVDIAEGSPAADAGIERGDVLLAVNGTPVQSQADIAKSAPVLTRAVESLSGQKLKTFAKLGAVDPVTYLRQSDALSTEVARKSETIVISMDGPDPDECASIANAVVNAYIAEQMQAKRSTGDDMIKVLRKESEALAQKRDEALRAMLKYKAKTGLLSFKDDKGNTLLERNASLDGALTRAEMGVIELQAQRAGDAPFNPGAPNPVAPNPARFRSTPCRCR